MGRDFNKKSFVVYKDWRTLVDSLSDTDAADLIRAMFAYQDGEKYTFRTPLMESVFVSMVIPAFKIDDDKYNRRCEANVENGKKGGRPKKQTTETETQTNPMGFNETQTNPMGFRETQLNPTKPDRDIDNEIDIDNDSKKEGNRTSNATFDVAHEPQTRQELLYFFKEIISFYEKNCPKHWATAITIDGNRGQRERNFKWCLKKCGFNIRRFMAVLKHAFVNLDEDSTTWKLARTQSEFDNLIKPEFFQPLLESAKKYWDSTK